MTKGFGFSVLLFPHLFEGIERKIVLEWNRSAMYSVRWPLKGTFSLLFPLFFPEFVASYLIVSLILIHVDNDKNKSTGEENEKIKPWKP